MDLPTDVYRQTNAHAVYLHQPDFSKASALPSWEGCCQARKAAEEVYKDVVTSMRTHGLLNYGVLYKQPCLAPDGKLYEQENILRRQLFDIAACTPASSLISKTKAFARSRIAALKPIVEFRRSYWACLEAFNVAEDHTYVLEVLATAEEGLLQYLLDKFSADQLSCLWGKLLKSSQAELSFKIVKHQLFSSSCSRCSRAVLSFIEHGRGVGTADDFDCSPDKLVHWLSCYKWDELSCAQLIELTAYAEEVRLKRLYLEGLVSFEEHPTDYASLLDTQLAHKLYLLPCSLRLYPSEGVRCFEIVSHLLEVLPSELRRLKSVSDQAYAEYVRSHLDFLASLEDYSQVIRRRPLYQLSRSVTEGYRYEYGKVVITTLTDSGLSRREVKLPNISVYNRDIFYDDVLMGKLYIGDTNEHSRVLCVDYRRDFAFVVLPNLPMKRYRFCIASSKDVVYVILAGSTDSQQTYDCLRYNAARWEVLPSLPDAVCLQQVLLLEPQRCLYALKRKRTDFHYREEPFEVVYELSLETLTWKKYCFTMQLSSWTCLKPQRGSSQLYIMTKRAVYAIALQGSKATLVKIREIRGDEVSTALYSQGHLILQSKISKAWSTESLELEL
jgi:hypothetical protein